MSLHDRVICGDSREVLKTLPDGCIDAVCTDPPYALSSSRNGKTGFMGSHWDVGTVAHDPAFWAEVRRVAKPGAFLLAFGGCRTYHRLVCAIEDAGWQPREMINWIFASGFPKSKSCLKPAHEPILLAKAPGPLQPLQIDACRVSFRGPADEAESKDKNQHGDFGSGQRHNRVYGADTNDRANYGAPGRWPPNVVMSHHPGCRPAGVRRVTGTRPARAGGKRGSPHVFAQDAYTQTYERSARQGYADADGMEQVRAWTCVEGCPVAALDAQAGPRPSSPGSTRGSDDGNTLYGNGRGLARPITGQSIGYDDTTPAVSRFFPTFPGADPEPEDAVPYFYTPKASRRDRGEGNNHSTVKPTALMAWLCKLATPPGGVVLDCFAGSGSTLVACVREGFGFIGIEQDSHYCDIARRRIAHAQQQRHGPLFANADAEKDA